MLRKRPYLRREWCVRVVEQPVRVEPQEDNRVRFRAPIPELGGRYLRVVTLADRTTITTPSATADSSHEARLPSGHGLAHIDLSEDPSVESREISEGVVLDYDGEGNLVDIDIDNASRKVELGRLIVSGLDEVERRAG